WLGGNYPGQRYIELLGDTKPKAIKSAIYIIAVISIPQDYLSMIL
ncbi:unnamed protein product, partial [marine sediment metagenome]